MHKTLCRTLSLVFLLAGSDAALAQTPPAAQPNLLTITREEVKPGRAAEHAKIEVGWPAAYEKAKSPYYYLALISMTGPEEAWYLSGFDSHAAIGDSFKREDANTDPVLAAELARLSRVDADMLNGIRRMQARALKELSYGTYPDLAKHRFFEITTFRVRPGHEPQFEAAAKAYGAAARRTGATSGYRVWEIIAGVPGPTYLIFSSVASYAEFDQAMADGDKTIAGVSADEGATLQKLMLEGVVNSESQRFRVDGGQSYVAPEWRAQYPAFWMPKKPAAPKPTGQ